MMNTPSRLLAWLSVTNASSANYRSSCWALSATVEVKDVTWHRVSPQQNVPYLSLPTAEGGTLRLDIYL
jgi:hypothetical protein